MTKFVETKERLAKIARTETDLLSGDFNQALNAGVFPNKDHEFFFYIRQAENRLEKIKSYINMIGALNGKSETS